MKRITEGGRRVANYGYIVTVICKYRANLKTFFLMNKLFIKKSKENQ